MTSRILCNGLTKCRLSEILTTDREYCEVSVNIIRIVLMWSQNGWETEVWSVHGGTSSEFYAKTSHWSDLYFTFNRRSWCLQMNRNTFVFTGARHVRLPIRAHRSASARSCATRTCSTRSTLRLKRKKRTVERGTTDGSSSHGCRKWMINLRKSR